MFLLPRLWPWEENLPKKYGQWAGKSEDTISKTTHSNNITVFLFLFIFSRHWVHGGDRGGVCPAARREGLQRGTGGQERGQDEADCAGNR